MALELSSAHGSVALLDGSVPLFVREFANDRKHSGLFFQNLQQCREEFGNAERIVVGLGPGSYAGTRIAIAAALGLQAATGAPVVGRPSLCAMPTKADEYVVVGDARRHSFFFARVVDRRCAEGPLLGSEDEIGERLSSLTCPVFSAETLAAFPISALLHPCALVLAQIAGNAEFTGLLEPIYLREPYITYPKAAAR